MRLTGTGLCCVRGGREVFSGLNFSVVGGEPLVLTGPNGAGKTTLLRALAGLLRLAAGEVELAGGDKEASLGEQAHYLGHQDAVKPALTIEENLVFWTAYFDDLHVPGGLGVQIPARKSVAQSLAAVGLDALADTPAAYLSAGQRRRLSLARLLSAPRPIWLLDEPTTALDAAAQEMLGALMRAQLAAGGIIIAATHGPLPLDRSTELQLGAQAYEPHTREPHPARPGLA